MPVTEIAQLRLQPGSSLASATLRQTLRQARDAMATSSGFQFELLHGIDDPSLLFVLGTWPSIEYHMTEFIPSKANQDLLATLQGQIGLEWMFHVDINDLQGVLPLGNNVVAISRGVVKDEAREAVEAMFAGDKSLGTEMPTVSGWRLDRGVSGDTSAVGGNAFQDEYVLVTMWDNAEQQETNANTLAIEALRGHFSSLNVVRAVKLNLDS